MAEQFAQSPAYTRVTVSTDGIDIPGAWRSRDGGDRSSTVRRYREGGDPLNEKVAPGTATTEDMTLTREFVKERDLEIWRFLYRNSGRAILTLSEQLLDDDGVPYGAPVVEQARLTGCSRPPVNSDDTDAISEFSITVAPFGELA